LYFKQCLFFIALLLFSTPAFAATPTWVAKLSQHEAIQQAEAKDREEVTCLALAIYFEARGESQKGQQAVGNVIINRTKNSRYPNTMCGVVFQKGQFTFIKKGRAALPKTPRMWDSAIAMAHTVIGGGSDVSNGALSFCQRRLRRSGFTIGNHVFY
jgi:spore germination cell wall hydrolase CwlJ-like protein